ncbi:MAG: cellulase family glycosylhydrolase, partial [Mycobacterium sp.]|nr:cellulase family glycosylhydrolase [Mycobacterium sp.]
MSPSRNSASIKHVGRVGALAVALGIGGAVAITPCVAWADDSVSTDSPSSTAESPSTTPDRAGRESQRAAGRERTSPTATASRPPSDATPGPRNSARAGVLPAAAVADAQGGSDYSPRPDIGWSLPQTGVIGSVTASAKPALPAPASAGPTLAAVTPQPAVAVAAVAQPAAAVSGSSLLAGVVPSGNGNQAPTGPLNFVTAALSLISREINRLLFNSGPTAKPVLTGQTNTLAGSIGGSDPEGDPLSYTIAEAPIHGSVVVDSAGNFTYTVDESLDATGGQDTFVVEVRDTGAGTARRFSASLSVAGPAPAATLPSSSPSVTYSVGDNWGSGFIGTMNVTAGQSNLNGWKVTFNTPAQITYVWNGVITSHVGDAYTVTNAAWNGQVTAGQSTSFGFQASPTSTGSAVTGLQINGVASGVTQTLPGVAVANATVAEPTTTSAPAVFVVTLSKASTTPISIGYTTSNGTATAGSDYTATSGTLSFAAGVTTQQISVPVLRDTITEPTETFAVTLSNPSGATLTTATATGTITDTAVTVTPPPSTGGGSVTYAVADNWGSGFTGTMNVTAGQALNGWTVSFNTPAEIVNVWNGVISSHVGTAYVVTNAPWNGQVGAGQSTSFGFQATTGAAGSAITGLQLNGVAVATPAPRVSIADLSVTEGNGEHAHFMFTATLDKASATPVSVGYATSNGTATAGVDYTASSGTITFAPGVTTQTVHVDVIGDAAIEPNETFSVNLSAPSGLAIARATAIGTILNDDVVAAPTPGLSISDAAATEPGSGGMAPGFLRTAGNQIIDSQGKTVQISGVNWFGMESTTQAPHGLWTRGYKEMIDQMVGLGFNTIRLPYSSELLHTSAAPNGIDFSKNPDLQGLSGLQVMDAIVAYAGQKGMRVILDHHRSGAGAGTSENGLWYDSTYTEDAWVADWVTLANRYKTNSTVIGFDLHNEPHNGTWGGGGATDWARAAERAGNAALAVNPNLLMFVEGVGTYQGQSYWWGGNLMGVKDRPIVFNVANRVVYSPHDYPNSVFPQTWFQTADFGVGLPAVFRKAWGYIYEENIAPIYIGEFGTKLVDPKDAVWLEALTSYISGDLDNNGTNDIPAGNQDISWTYWSWNPNSGDTGGILADDWRTVNQSKMAYLTPVQFTAAGGSSLAAFTVSLSKASTSPITVGYTTSNGTATAGSDYIASSGTLTFAPGETSRTIAIIVNGDATAEARETFTVTLSNPSGATLVD